MFKRLFYWIICSICRIGMHLYFRGIEINGIKSIPKDGAIIYAPNHQNAFLDAIIIAVFSPTPVTFFTRADIFKQPFIWFLDALNMVPVLRAKDGFSKVMENDLTFQRSIKLLLNNKPVMVFPEANHGFHYYLRILSKGTARLAFDAQFKSDHPVYIVPVGINFFRHHKPRYKLVLNYGGAINMQEYTDAYMDHKGRSLSNIRNIMTTELKSQMLIPDSDEYYDDRVKVLSRSHEKLSFNHLRVKVDNRSFVSEKSYPVLKPLINILTILNFPVIKVSQWALKKIGDPIYGGSIKFATGIFFLPFWYLFVFAALSFYFPNGFAALVAVALLTSLFIRQEFIRLAHP